MTGYELFGAMIDRLIDRLDRVMGLPADLTACQLCEADATIAHITHCHECDTDLCRDCYNQHFCVREGHQKAI